MAKWGSLREEWGADARATSTHAGDLPRGRPTEEKPKARKPPRLPTGWLQSRTGKNGAGPCQGGPSRHVQTLLGCWAPASSLPPHTTGSASPGRLGTTGPLPPGTPPRSPPMQTPCPVPSGPAAAFARPASRWTQTSANKRVTGHQCGNLGRLGGDMGVRRGCGAHGRKRPGALREVQTFPAGAPRCALTSLRRRPHRGRRAAERPEKPTPTRNRPRTERGRK